LDYSSISKYLSLSYIPSPNTIYKNIKKLPAGSFLVFNIRKNNFYIKKYWEPKFDPKIDISYEEAKEKTQKILKDSVNIRMISDVPVGVLLSGGVDSSSIVAALAHHSSKINTFSVGFTDSKFDERKFSRRIARSVWN
jgi:asparagine synthase (glutamine-hydrolysing)